MFMSIFNDKKRSKLTLIWFHLFTSQMHLDLKLINPLSIRDSDINQLKICCIY